MVWMGPRWARRLRRRGAGCVHDLSPSQTNDELHVATILLADDQDVNRRVLGKLLGSRGHRVVDAVDGQAALERTRAEPFDLAMVDLLMPGMDGFEFVHRLRQEPGPAAQTAVVFISAIYMPAEVRELARLCGVTHVLSRSESIEEILATVDDAMREPQTRVTVPDRSAFSLGLLKLLNRKVSENLHAVIPTIAEIADRVDLRVSP